MKTLTIAITLLAAALAAQAQTNVYRWVDKDGKVHFSDAPPPSDAKDATQRRMGGGGEADSQLPFATRIAAQRYPVTIFTGAACGEPCISGRDLLTRRGVPYTERDAQANAEDREALRKLIGTLDVPLLLVGESQVKGYEEGRWNASLDGAGYPRTRLPGQASLRQNPPVAPAAPPAAKPLEPAAEGAPAEPPSR